MSVTGMSGAYRGLAKILRMQAFKHSSVPATCRDLCFLQADLVILTNNNPRGETPANIVADVVSGYPDELLAFNASQAYPMGFLHDPGRIPVEALEFSWQNCFEYVPLDQSGA